MAPVLPVVGVVREGILEEVIAKELIGIIKGREVMQNSSKNGNSMK